MEAIILDTETTGVNEPHATQISWVAVDFKANQLKKIGVAFGDDFNPLKPISYGAMATTGVCDEDIANCKPHTSFELPKNLEYIIGHNIDFDCQVLVNANCDVSKLKRICTLALSRKYFPDMDSHTLLAMLYLLNYKVAREFVDKGHNAMYDVYFTYCILEQICSRVGITSLEQLYKLSEQARVPEFIGFGKHKGMAIKDLPSDYVNWLLRQPDIDPYLRKALEQ